MIYSSIIIHYGWGSGETLDSHNGLQACGEKTSDAYFPTFTEILCSQINRRNTKAEDSSNTIIINYKPLDVDSYTSNTRHISLLL